MTDVRTVSVLSAAHSEGIRTLSAEPDVAAAAGMRVNLSPEEAAEYIHTATEAAEEGRSHVFVLTKGGDVLGICRLIGVLGLPRLIVAIGRAYRGQGNGSLLVRHVLEFAFENLQLERVTATGACLGIVAQFGAVDGSGLSRQTWGAARARTGS